MADHTKGALSPGRRRLLELLQQINFGRLESLIIRDGEPIFEPMPLRRLEVKFGGENGPRPELSHADFALKQQVVDLFVYFDQLQDGVIDVLEVKHGLPFRMMVTEGAA